MSCMLVVCHIYVYVPKLGVGQDGVTCCCKINQLKRLCRSVKHPNVVGVEGHKVDFADRNSQQKSVL
jgi:hypothetical protein